MSLIINCQWYPPAEITVEDRLSEVEDCLAHPAIVALNGPDWYDLGRSKADARRRVVSTDAGFARTAWKIRRYSPTECSHTLSAWNGLDVVDGASLTADINEPPNHMDFIALAGQDLECLAATTSWHDVLECARVLASIFGGMSIVTSNELIEQLATNDEDGAEFAAYAAFWGIDRSGRAVTSSKHDTSEPHALVCAQDWSQVATPDPTCIRALIKQSRP